MCDVYEYWNRIHLFEICIVPEPATTSGTGLLLDRDNGINKKLRGMHLARLHSIGSRLDTRPGAVTRIACQRRCVLWRWSGSRLCSKWKRCSGMCSNWRANWQKMCFNYVQRGRWIRKPRNKMFMNISSMIRPCSSSHVYQKETDGKLELFRPPMKV